MREGVAAGVMGRGEALASAMLVCVAGPDLGKRIEVSRGGITIGRSPRADLVSDDPQAEPKHVFIRLQPDGVFLRAFETAALRADGRRLSEGYLAAGQAVEIGTSTWLLEGTTDAPLLDRLGGHIAYLAGVDKIEGFGVRELFSEAFKKRSDDEIEEHFAAGTRRTSPALLEIDADWPKPWVFVKVFTLVLLVYICFALTFRQFPNEKLIPGLIVTGAFAVPFAVLIFFFEVNAARNVSIFQVMRLVLLGGALSIMFTLAGSQLVSGVYAVLGAMAAGLIEEIAKAMALLLVVNSPRYRWTLNGLLFGAAVGTGFAAFESAGYAFSPVLVGAVQGNLGAGLAAMEQSIHMRGMLALAGGHIAWTGLVGAALWKVKGGRRLDADMLKDERFLRVLALSMGLHMLWNSPIDLPFLGKFLIIGAVSWTAVIAFVQDGLRQIKREQGSVSSRLTSLPASERRTATPKHIFIIGRQSDCDIVLADASVSRRHAQIVTLSHDRRLLVDLGSQNGTALLVNGARQPIRQHDLAPDDVVMFGNLQMRGRELLQAISPRAH